MRGPLQALPVPTIDLRLPTAYCFIAAGGLAAGCALRRDHQAACGP